jgi:hypothetical protein
MNKFEEKSKRELLAGLRTAVKALEPMGGVIRQMGGKVVNEERVKELPSADRVSQAILPPKGAQSASPP